MLHTNESDQSFSLETLERELRRKKEKIEHAIAPEISDIMAGVRTMIAGDTLDVESTVAGDDGQPKVYVTITKESENVFTLFTRYVNLGNHQRGPCLGVGEIPLGAGMMFMALGGNSTPPTNGFTRRRHQPNILKKFLFLQH
ncbi:hypothetical protein COU79_05505 [Candidatus Peregrinibacteria bacterium CG10_big_fil_rev_8_21_14_0_10_54_7]|nr:MAG: hypothetical protein COU79_05505 [Candidatus Peregrinibacteria bacterium CG10_big_fil_rev_8_21_14_0_10_54_7]